MASMCGLDCVRCPMRQECGGCSETSGRPFGGGCMLAQCQKGCAKCDASGSGCALVQGLVAEFNALQIADMPPITGLYPLKSSFVNMEYLLPGGKSVKFWPEDRILLGNQVCKRNSERCYGLAADEKYLLVCEYSAGGADPEIVIYKRR